MRIYPSPALFFLEGRSFGSGIAVDSAQRPALLARFRATLRARLQRIADELDELTWVASRRDSALGELHTLKGEARMLGLLKLARLAHELESSVAEQPVGVDRSVALDEMRLALEEHVERTALNTARHDGAEQVPVMLSEWARHAEALAAESGKLLRVSVRAESVGLAGANLEELWAALLHLLQNAVDHGLELPHERGEKPREGRLTLSVDVRGSFFVLTVEDDGRGIDLEAIRRAALVRGVHEVSALGDRELLELLFEPGFSTRTEVTTLSGRGVGLGAARRQVEALGGRVTLETELGRGTRFVISVPGAPSAR